MVLATGISSVATQLYTIREFLSLFEGNEFVIALILCAWLLLGGIGTLLSQAASRHRDPLGLLARLTLLLAALPVLQILGVRLLRELLFLHGASVGLGKLVAFSLVCLAPYTLTVGFVLPLSLFAIRRQEASYPGVHVYITDNIGDVTGGALFAFVLVALLTPLQARCVADLVLMACGLRLSGRGRPRRAGVLLGMAVLGVNLAGLSAEKASLATGQGELVHYEETRYGRITVLRDQGQYTLFENGVPLYSSSNTFAAEEAIHFPLSQRADPAEVLLVSAGGGMLEELAKYAPSRVAYVRLDPAISRVELSLGLLGEIPGLEVINADGRAFLASTTHTYDTIILNLPDPDTFLLNRFYTAQFFTLARRRLREGGVLSFTVSGYENYLGATQRREVSCLYKTVRDVFPHVLMLPGRQISFLCSDAPLSPEIPELLAARGIKTAYIEGYFTQEVNAERRQYLADALDAHATPNRDLSPVMLRYMFAQWFAKHGTRPIPFLLAAAVLVIGYALHMGAGEYVLFTTGWTTMAGEILVIFVFQIFYGYVYLKIGLIVTVFLAGLLPGALLGQWLRARGRRVLLMSDGLIVILLGTSIAGLVLVGASLPQGCCIAYGGLLSVLCGLQFPVALSLRGGNNPAMSRVVAADLLGAACGTMVTSAIGIPLLGIIGATGGLIALKLSSIMVTGLCHGQPQPS